jgi:hypothetical protein
VALAQVTILFGPRKGAVPWLATIIAFVGLVPMIARSVDPLFSAGAVIVVLSARAARMRFPSRKPHGAPRLDL